MSKIDHTVMCGVKFDYLLGLHTLFAYVYWNTAYTVDFL